MYCMCMYSTLYMLHVYYFCWCLYILGWCHYLNRIHYNNSTWHALRARMWTDQPHSEKLFREKQPKMQLRIWKKAGIMRIFFLPFFIQFIATASWYCGLFILVLYSKYNSFSAHHKSLNNKCQYDRAEWKRKRFFLQSISCLLFVVELPQEFLLLMYKW